MKHQALLAQHRLCGHIVTEGLGPRIHVARCSLLGRLPDSVCHRLMSHNSLHCNADGELGRVVLVLRSLVLHFDVFEGGAHEGIASPCRSNLSSGAASKASLVASALGEGTMPGLASFVGPRVRRRCRVCHIASKRPTPAERPLLSSWAPRSRNRVQFPRDILSCHIASPQ